MSSIHELTPDFTDTGSRLDLYLEQSIPGLSRSQAKKLILAGLVSVANAVQKKVSFLIEAGVLIHVEIPEPKKLDLTPQKVDIEILFEDEHLAVLHKPAGISVHPSTTENAPTVVHGLLHDLKTLSQVGGVERPGIVHRIDKGTSGVLVVSKTDLAHVNLSEQFKKHTIDRRYTALVYGDVHSRLKKKEGRIETFFGRNPKDRKKMTGKLTEGRKAITHWKVLKSFKELTLIECRLETGRTHQIRVHLTEMGFPVVGDPLYGDHLRYAKKLSNLSLSKKCSALSHQLLHAASLSFIHPVKKEAVSFESPLPADFQEILALL